MRAAWSSMVEEHVTEIWNRVLDVSEGEGDATFCELGGHAIAAVRIVAHIQDKLGIMIEPAELFKDGTLKTLVDHVRAKAAE